MRVSLWSRASTRASTRHARVRAATQAAVAPAYHKLGPKLSIGDHGSGKLAKASRRPANESSYVSAPDTAGPAVVRPVRLGAIGACTGGVTLSNYQPTDLQSGCAYVDKSFSNFAVNSGVGSTVGNAGHDHCHFEQRAGDALTSTSGLGVADFYLAGVDPNQQPQRIRESDRRGLRGAGVYGRDGGRVHLQQRRERLCDAWREPVGDFPP